MNKSEQRGGGGQHAAAIRVCIDACQCRRSSNRTTCRPSLPCTDLGVRRLTDTPRGGQTQSSPREHTESLGIMRSPGVAPSLWNRPVMCPPRFPRLLFASLSETPFLPTRCIHPVSVWRGHGTARTAGTAGSFSSRYGDLGPRCQPPCLASPPAQCNPRVPPRRQHSVPAAPRSVLALRDASPLACAP